MMKMIMVIMMVGMDMMDSGAEGFDCGDGRRG